MTTQNIAAFLESIGNPQNNYKTIHIGGSNGKGTTSYFLYQMLKQQGLNVGVYVSPYRLERFDNIIHDDIRISEIDHLHQTYEDMMLAFNLTPFEIDTALMYMMFDLKKVTHAVIEVGLGGRDDATNVIHADLAIITSISLEHTEILGKRIEDIIDAKAGIFKPNQAVILSPYMNAYEKKLFESYVEKIKGFVLPTSDLSYDVFDIPYLNHNVNLAYQACRYIIHEPNIDFKTLQVMSYRFEYLTEKIILDGAHNLEGIEALIEAIKKKKMYPIIIMSVIKTKPIHEMVHLLKHFSKAIIITHFDHQDAYDLKTLTHVKDTTFMPLEDILPYMKHIKYDTIIITGSLYFLRAIEPLIRRLKDEQV